MLEGFDPRWKDFPDYIIGITKDIWEDRNFESLRHRYAPNIPVRSPSGVIIGNVAVIEATKATLAEFPDRQLLAEDVIWSGNSKDGYFSSHRILSTATHARDGTFGKATGKKLVYRVIADCAALKEQIYDEWLVRDLGAIVRQMGWDPKTYASDLIKWEGGPECCRLPFAPERDVEGPYKGRGNTNIVGQRYAATISALMGGDVTAINREYDRAVQAELPGGITRHGRESVESFWLDLRAALPDGKFEMHHVIGRTDAMMPQRAAIRWSLAGKHSGRGLFGSPTGAFVHVMGISHAEFGPWGLRREYVLFDEVAIWKQILLKTG